MSRTESEIHEPKIKVIHISSWFPSKELPYLGNFVAQFISGLSPRVENTVLRRFSGKESSNFKSVFCANPSFITWSKFVHQQVRTSKAEILHLHVAADLWFLGFTLPFIWKKPMVLTEHGSYFQREIFMQLPFYKKAGIKRLLNRANKTIAVSEVLQVDIQRSTGVTPQIIGNFIADSWIQIEPRTPDLSTYQFLHVSSLASIKNPMGIINAALITRQAGYTNFHLTIIAEQKNCEVRTFIEVMQMSSYVTLLDALPHAEVEKEMERAHCFILNSNYETFSIVALEALGKGLQLISTPVGFVNGLDSDAIETCEFNDAELLSSKMMKCISKQIYAGNKASKLVDKYTESQIITQYIHLYHELLNGKK